jgi:hypothetical protein
MELNQHCCSALSTTHMQSPHGMGIYPKGLEVGKKDVHP